jgi:hypothetical protein
VSAARIKATGAWIVFPTMRAARAFAVGYCVPRVIVRLRRGRFAIVSPATAGRRGLRVLASFGGKS